MSAMLHLVLIVVVVGSSLLCKGQSADSSTEPDVILVISPDNQDNYCVASGNPAVDSALAWVRNNTKDDYTFLERTSSILPRTESSLKCSFDEYGCTSLWNEENWFWERSYYNPLFPRTDAAWEDFSVNYDSDFEGVYKAVNILKNPTYFFGLSLKINGSGHFALCQDAYVRSLPCYTVIFNFSGPRDDIEIFKCANGLHHYSKNCTRHNVSKTDQHIFSEEVWRHFLVAFNGTELSVYGNLDAESNHHRYEKILSFDDVDPINVSHIAFKDNYGTSRWKLHDYTFIKITTSSSEARFFKEAFSVKQTFCLSMAVALCDGCTFQLHLRLTDGQMYNSIKIQGTERVKDSSDVPLYWKVERFEFTISTYEDSLAELLYSTTAINSVKNSFWAVDDIRECQNDEQRILRYNGILPPPATCQVLNRPDYIAVGRRHGGAIGEFSTNKPCKNWAKQLSNGTFSCKGYKFCSAKAAKPNINHCSCFPGYNGDCNVLTHITSIELVNTSYRHGQVRLPSEAINGTTASFMKIQYQMKRAGRSYWRMVSEPLSIDEAYKSFQLLTLVADETHELQALLYIHGDYEGPYTRSPYITFTTTCTDIESSDVTVSSTEDSITFHLQTDDSSDKCTLNKYSFFCKEQVGFYSNDRVQSSDGRSFTYLKLKPFTKYEVSIQPKSSGAQTLYHKIVTTKQSAPSKVRDIQRVYSTNTSISIAWKEPSTLNGVIKGYIVSYKIFRHKSCSRNTTNAESKNVLTEDKYITIEGLIPFSNYNITVQAWVEGNDSPLIGPAESAFVDTKQEEFAVESMLKLRENQTISREFATLRWSTPKCEDVRGSIWYNYYLTGRSEWDKQTQNGSTQDTHIKIEGLIPFSIYTVYLGISRTQGGKFGTGSNQTYTFRTLHKFPLPLQNFTVYSVDTDLVFVRWMPPYPPFGDREGYFWKPYKYHENLIITHVTHDYGTEMDTVTCPLWDGYLCAEIKGLIESQYYIVYARNKGAALNGETVNLKFTWQHKASSAPPNFAYVSTDNNLVFNLTWEYPVLPNGKLKKFRIDINVTSTQLLRQLNSNEVHTALDVEINEIKKNYYFQTPALPSASRVSVTVTAINNLPGEPAILMIDTEVPAPNVTGNITAKVISDTLREIKISPGNINITQTSGVYILVMEVGSKNNDKYNPRLVTRDRADYKEIFEAAKVEAIEFAWIAVKLDQIPTEETIVRIGDNSGDTFWNKPLDAEKMYYFVVLLYNEINSARVYFAVPIDKRKSANTSRACFAALLLLLLVPVIIYFAYKRFHKQKKQDPTDLYDDVAPFRRKEINVPDYLELLSAPVNKTSTATTEIATGSKDPSSTTLKLGNVITVDDFKDVVKFLIKYDKLRKQFKMISPNNTVATANEHTRVHLTDCGPYIECVDANFVNGYEKLREYIATRSPHPDSVNVFWQMIWQEGVTDIVMMSTTMEIKPSQTEVQAQEEFKYWPRSQVDSKCYGPYSVKLTSYKIKAFYSMRILYLKFQDEPERKIRHFQFTAWPAAGTPFYPNSVASFMKQIRSKGQRSGPLLTHCCDGNEKTGTIILADICANMASKENAVDILKHLHEIRKQRPTLVRNLETYKFIHLVLAEYLHHKNTAIECAKLKEAVLKIKQSKKLAQQLAQIDLNCWKENAPKNEVLCVASLDENRKKNRFPDIVPDEKGRVHLTAASHYSCIGRFSGYTDEGSSYINAVHCDGYNLQNQYIVTQLPLADTLEQFWRMISEYEVNTIVSLNEISTGDQSTCQFWPTSETETMNPFSYITLEHHSETDTEFYSTTVIILTDNRKCEDDASRYITVVQFKGWFHGKLLPTVAANPVETLLHLVDQVEKVKTGSAPIVMTCHDGATGCGLFVALSYVIEKMKLEQLCDVPEAVQIIRKNRAQFITKLAQFEFLYDAAVKYIESFEKYRNFK